MVTVGNMQDKLTRQKKKKKKLEIITELQMIDREAEQTGWVGYTDFIETDNTGLKAW